MKSISNFATAASASQMKFAKAGGVLKPASQSWGEGGACSLFISTGTGPRRDQSAGSCLFRGWGTPRSRPRIFQLPLLREEGELSPLLREEGEAQLKLSEAEVKFG